MLTKIAKKLAIGAAAIALGSIGSAASAHMVQFGWDETPTGTVLWAEHWHGTLAAPYSDNGGLTITDTATMTSIVVQWTGVVNGATTASLNLTGSQCDPVNGPCDGENNWLHTAALPLGNGVYDFFTGTRCCVDTMTQPVRVTITGITQQPPGIGTGAVPEPSTWAMMLIGFGATGYAMRRRRTKVAAHPQLA